MTVNKNKSEVLLATQDGTDTPLGEMVKLVESRFSITFDSITGKSRDPKIVRARHAFMWLAKEKLNWSFSGIGRFIGKDHSTVMHAYNKFDIRDFPEIRDYARKSIDFSK